MRKKAQKAKYLVGIDEAGRGPLAGPVAVGVAVFQQTINSKQQIKKILKGIRDSKKFSEKQREEWYKKLKMMEKGGIVKCAVGFSSVKVIDETGIVVAIRRALARALKKLDLSPNACEVLLDGSLKAPAEYKNQKTIIHGDDIEPVISAASIIAKVSRDRRMKGLAKKFPGYGFEIHKGYGTKAHYRALKNLRPLEIHRQTFLHL
ncbi:MAG: ribonuclease HII [Candidatus Paceibacterota bacterium]